MTTSVPAYKSQLLSKYTEAEETDLNVVVSAQTFQRLEKKTAYINELLRLSGRRGSVTVDKILEDVIKDGLDADQFFLKYEATEKIPGVLNPQTEPKSSTAPKNKNNSKALPDDTDKTINNILSSSLGSPSSATAS